MTLLLVVLLPFLGAMGVAWASKLGRATAILLTLLVVLAPVILILSLLDPLVAGETRIERFTWLPAVGLDIAFRLDGLGLLFAGLILGIGGLVVLYARYYLSEQDNLGRLYAYLLLFMGAMLGVVLSENLIQMLMFWELTSLSSFLLIGYWRQREDARQGARMALAMTGAGGLALFGGILLLGQMTGSYDLSVVLASGDLIRAHPLYGPTLLLILLGIFTKSAQFPFHFWLPHAMAAPTPVSSYLHSATMVKAGVFLLARLFPALSGTWEWNYFVTGLGLMTLLTGAVIALFQHDIKGLLAYSTISHLGLITVLFGIGTPLAAVAGVFHIINHATFKAGLFMAAGIIDHETGTRDMRRINGLWRSMPYTGTLAMVAASAMAGVPLFNGFLSKEMFFGEAAAVAGSLWLGWLVPVAATLAGAFAVAYSLRFVHDVFFNGEPVDLPRQPHEPPRWMRVPVEVLVVLCLLVGMAPALTVEPILNLAVSAVLQGPPPAHDLALWHGFTPAVFMSLIAMTGGVLIYAVRQPLYAGWERVGDRLDARRGYDRVLNGLIGLAQGLTAWLGKASLQRLLLTFLLSALVLGTAGWLGSGSSLTGPLPLLAPRRRQPGGQYHHGRGRPRDPDLVLPAPPRPHPPGCRRPHGRPDFRHLLRPRPGLDPIVRRGGDRHPAAAGPLFPPPDLASGDPAPPAHPGSGGGVVRGSWHERPDLGPPDPALREHRRLFPGEQHSRRRWPQRGQCHPGGFSWLRHPGRDHGPGPGGSGDPRHAGASPAGGPAGDDLGRPWNRDAHPIILSSLARLVLPLTLLVAVFILLRGHNLPGGGFIAGLVTAIALILQYLANGVAWTQQRLPGRMQPRDRRWPAHRHPHGPGELPPWLSLPDDDLWPFRLAPGG